MPCWKSAERATYNETMLSEATRDRLVVVLVSARNPQNIGAAARAMQDFGFQHLRVVNEYASPFETAKTEATSAVGARTVMERACRFDTLADAVADCHVIAGTTAIGERNLQQAVLPLHAAAPQLMAALRDPEGEPQAPDANPLLQESEQPHGSRVALLFGSEKTGLTREQLSFCSVLLTIPLFAPEGRHLSMNLGQSVAVCLYELTRDGFEGARALPAVHQEPMAASADRERLLGVLLALMHRSDYARRFPANARVAVVRQLVSKLGATRDETATWIGFFRLIMRRLPEPEREEVTL